jgi:hypothetical protein
MKDILKSWVIMNGSLMDLTEDQILELIEYEKANLKRKSLIKRMHERYSMLRSIRERAKLMEDIK